MEFKLPAIGEGVYEAELVRWLVKPGDTIKAGHILAEVLTDKATMEVPAPFAGTIVALKAEPGQAVKVGAVLIEYTPLGEPAEKAPVVVAPLDALPAPTRPAAALPNGSTLAATPMMVKAAPSVRQMARKMGIDLTTVSGSGPEGRILIEDLSRFVRPGIGQDMPKPLPPEPRFDYGRPGTRIKLLGVRRRIAEHMAQAKRTIPHYSYIDEADVTQLVNLRGALKDVYARAGIKLTYLAFFVKAVVCALKEIPLVNSSLDEPNGEIVLHDRYHVGIAVATANGLIVPVIRDADKKDLGMIAREIDRLSSEARAGRSRLEDLKEGVFTITSVGNLGGLISTPVINHPEVGILGIGKVVRRPVYDDAGQIRPAELVYLSFSFDHRVVDGAVGAVFGNVVRRELENPARLLLPEKL
jgi:pyruvate dehydrogenase E2 component (dihydrolipoamide acetyltransferase)/2-oxoisovalerate dehydrogenase E2 component (dihydrolipoyl transacylase)